MNNYQILGVDLFTLVVNEYDVGNSCDGLSFYHSSLKYVGLQ